MKTLYVSLLSFALGLSSAFAGGASGGGGDLDPDKKPTPEEVKKFIDENYKIVVPALFNWEGSSMYSSSPGHMGFRRRLFPAQGSTAVDVAKSVKVNVEIGRVCIDPDSKQQKDGAVLADGTICIDPVRVADKTNITTYKLKSMALVAHEVTHLMGPAPKDQKEKDLREIEAKGFETTILNNTEPNIDAGRVKQRADYLKKDIESLHKTLDQYWKAFEKQLFDDQITCFYFGILGRQMRDLGKYEGFHHIVGASPIHYSVYPALFELEVRAYNMGGYCATDRIPGYRQDIDSKFEGKNELPVDVFSRKRGWVGVTSQRPIRNIQYLDRADAIQEMIYMKVLLDEVKRLGRL